MPRLNEKSDYELNRANFSASMAIWLLASGWAIAAILEIPSVISAIIFLVGLLFGIGAVHHFNQHRILRGLAIKRIF